MQEMSTTRKQQLLEESRLGIRKIAESIDGMTNAIMAMALTQKKLRAFLDALSEDIPDEARDKGDFTHIHDNLGAAAALLVSPLAPSLDRLEVALNWIDAAKGCI